MTKTRRRYIQVGILSALALILTAIAIVPARAHVPVDAHTSDRAQVPARVLVPARVHDPSPDLPPRPTPVASPVPAAPVEKRRKTGGLIEVRAHFEPGGSWSAVDTLVQWLDVSGTWHDVPGWRGEFDDVNGSEGRKAWWVDESHLGRGPFRWVLYRQADGEVLATSDPFDLPSSPGHVVRVSVPVASSGGE